MRNKAAKNRAKFTVVSVSLERHVLPINGYDYFVDRKLGRGSYGAVYAARRAIDGEWNLSNTIHCLIEFESL